MIEANVERLLAIARAEIGYHEKESNSDIDSFEGNSGDENFTKYARDLHINHYYQADKNGYDWCDMFCDWCFLMLCGSREAAEVIQCQSGPYGAGCYWSAQYYDAHGRLFYKDPQPGDQVFFGDYDHTGIVEKVENGIVHTIEGNSGNQVRRREYDENDSWLTSYGRPRWNLVPDNVFPFIDVSAYDWFKQPIEWGVKADIVEGVDDLHFEPYKHCTRAEIVTMLWRMNHCPDAKSENSFDDVKSGRYYYKAVEWAKSNGIVMGVDIDTFAPNEECTRGQVITMLWRMGGSKNVRLGMPFTDIHEGDYYYDAIRWACMYGITNGVSDTKFEPDEPCTRAQMVKFLFQYNKSAIMM